jgi:type II secretory pathway component PulC
MNSLSLLPNRFKHLFEGPQAIWLSLLILGLYLLVYSVVDLTFFLYPDSQATESQLTAVASHHPHKSMVLSYPLFGNYIPKSNDKNAIPQTLLNIKLVGVLKASQKRFSQVTIQIAGGKEKNYSLGDILPSGAKIIRIYDDGALLLRNGQVERLSLPIPPLPKANQTKPLEFEP